MIRTVIVDDEDLLRSGLRLLLSADERIEVVGEATNGRAGLELIRRAKPDVVLLDLRMPLLDGVGVLRELGGSVPALVLTAFDTDEFLRSALRAGAVGFVVKSSAPDVLADAVVAAADGRSTLSPGLLARALAPERPAALDQLSQREREVAQLIARGLTNPEISARLFISLPTVKTHITRIMDKLGVENRTQLAVEVAQRY